jgi:hypothetical protein
VSVVGRQSRIALEAVRKGLPGDPIGFPAEVKISLVEKAPRRRIDVCRSKKLFLTNAGPRGRSGLSAGGTGWCDHWRALHLLPWNVKRFDLASGIGYVDRSALALVQKWSRVCHGWSATRISALRSPAARARHSRRTRTRGRQMIM